jgi:hypothetical protein
MNTGTCSTLNQIRANRIIEMTGTDRKRTMMGLNAASTTGFKPLSIPMTNAHPKARIKPNSPLIMVEVSDERNPGSPNKWMSAVMLSAGPGKI